MTWGSPVPAWSLLRSTNPAAKAMVQANKAMITVAVSCTPEPGDDVVAHYSSIQSALGVTRARAELYCNIGLLCRRMPRLKQHLSAGMLSIDHLRQLARSVDGVRPEDTAAAENALIKVLTPRRTGQSIFSPRTMFNHILKALHTIDALARPVDDTEPPMDPVTLADYCGDAEQSEPAPDLDPERQSEQDAIELAAAEAADAMADETDSATSTTRRVSVDTYDPLSTVITATLPAAEAVEFMTILDAVCANMRCNRAEALMHLAHGTAEVEVTLNLYREINSDIVATDSGHWLDKVATRKFMDRVTHLRIPGHDVTETYTPTGQIRDFVTACYGTCTFPGCEVPATRCDLDHIHRYDHENPENGGPTDTHNLHPVCRRHHQLKTLGWQDVSRAADGAVMWSSVDDGHTYVSEPTGPLAGFARTTFAEQASHRYRATRDHNIRVAGRHLALRRALLDARTTAANDPCEVPF
ncbi:MAG TPA: HNH endonuclease [Candidatus Corynebacterium avicola]|uniref:HNH endonuclease n=1 Tax=Candidatus Corynebacterium avicola TaxID=2838527 RepID=A0A9D1ULY3_9CORY|nr:HNH endonuclease [Candidatus Corynebacterium avicola]